MAIEHKSYLQQLADADRHDRGPADDTSFVERTLNQLEAHEASERALLADYHYAATLGNDPGVRFLMGLILQDEERHQQLVSAMARDVRAGLLWTPDESSLPAIEDRPEDHDRLVRQTERFLEIERENAEGLKELKQQVKQMHAGLLELIVEGMEADTRKHIGVLKYIRKQLGTR